MSVKDKVEEIKDFMIDIHVKVSIKDSTFPDEQANAIVDRIKTKIFCSRETTSLVGLRTDVYEVCHEDEDEES